MKYCRDHKNLGPRHFRIFALRRSAVVRVPDTIVVVVEPDEETEDISGYDCRSELNEADKEEHLEVDLFEA